MPDDKDTSKDEHPSPTEITERAEEQPKQSYGEKMRAMLRQQEEKQQRPQQQQQEQQ